MPEEKSASSRLFPLLLSAHFRPGLHPYVPPTRCLCVLFARMPGICHPFSNAAPPASCPAQGGRDSCTLEHCHHSLAREANTRSPENCFSLALSFSLSLCLSLSLYVSPSLSISLCLCLSLSVSLPLFLSLSVSPSLSLFILLPPSIQNPSACEKSMTSQGKYGSFTHEITQHPRR